MKTTPTTEAVLEMLRGCPDGATTDALALHFEYLRLLEILYALHNAGTIVGMAQTIVTLENKPIRVTRWRLP